MQMLAASDAKQKRVFEKFLIFNFCIIYLIISKEQMSNG